jgi:hypothetical protein
MLRPLPLLLLAVLVWLVPVPGRAATDPVVFSFASVGDSRGDPATPAHGQDRIWGQNSRALARILREVGAQRPHALFFNGDMIMGYGGDRARLDREYAFWRGMAATLFETGTYVVPVPGNHEVQEKLTDAAGKVSKLTHLVGEQSWRDNMGDLILDQARWRGVTGIDATAFTRDHAPAPGTPDKIHSDQSQLSYSFDVGRSHIAVINTDPYGNDGHAPSHWLAADFAAAAARGARHYFVFGHKPAATYLFRPDLALEGLDQDPAQQALFWNVIERYGASYFCGHQHIFNLQQPTRQAGGKAWQIMVGSGGTPFSAERASRSQPFDRMYAWVKVEVRASGRVKLVAYGFDEHYGPTRTLAAIDLAR